MSVHHRRFRWGAAAAATLLCLAVGARGLAQGPAGAAVPLSADDAQARETFTRVCGTCHPVDRVIAEGRSRAQWETTIIAMQTSRGATITPDDFDRVLDYLTKFHARDSVARPGAVVTQGPNAGPRAHVGAADRHRVEPAAALRGQSLYAAQCVTCHGANIRGTERGPNLVRSPRVLRDRYGSAIGPLLKGGHPMQTGSAAALSDAQIADISHFIWDRINSTLRGAPEFDVKDVLTGDAAAGRMYFNGEGGCAACHSPTGDLAGFGRRYAPVDIQQRFVFPAAGGGGGRGGKPRPQVMVTVTVPGLAPVSGTLVSLDDFHVALRDAGGQHRSWIRTPDMTVVKDDPYAAHVALLDRLTDKAMHDVVAYLETLQ
ncbi:MAG: c-type cytochrome [Acidobacteria bacterium]|nr:c-type cytochrome [Acidobacteriota bacterium]